MTLDEKLRVFYDSTIADATKQSEDILVEYQASLKNLYEEHKKESEEKAAFTLETESKKLVQEKNKVLSIQSLDFKRQLNEKNEDLKDALFVDIKKRLEDFMKTNEYIDLLVNQIKSAVSFARDDAMTIYINASDQDKKADLEARTNTPVTISTIDFMGGTRAVIHEKNILIDRSFSTKLADEKDTFTL